MTHPTMTAGVASPMRLGDWVVDPPACTLAAPVAGRIAAALTFSDLRSFVCSRS